jgi:hypothetical protein
VKPQEEGRARRNERIALAGVGYGTALLLLLLGLFVNVGAEGQRYLFDGALICAVSFTAALLRTLWRKHR